VHHMSSTTRKSDACGGGAARHEQHDAFWSTSLFNGRYRLGTRARGREVSPLTTMKRLPIRKFCSHSTVVAKSTAHPRPGAVQLHPDALNTIHVLQDRMIQMLRLHVENEAKFLQAFKQDVLESKSVFKPRLKITISYKMRHKMMTEATVQIGDYIKYQRQDMIWAEHTAAVRPFNWIATIPLSFHDNPSVDVVVNNELFRHNVNTGIFELEQKSSRFSFCLGLTFHDTGVVPRYGGSTTTAELLMNVEQEQYAQLENLLNTAYAEEMPDTMSCREAMQQVSNIDQCLVEHRQWTRGIHQMCCLDANSSIIGDMVCHNAPTPTKDSDGIPLIGSISRQQVLESIDLDKVTFLQSNRYDLVWPKRAQHALTIARLYHGIGQMATTVMPFAELVASLYKFQSLRILANNLNVLSALRVDLLQSMIVPHSTLDKADFQLCMRTIHCIDQCLQHNIDALCGTQGHMHDVCLIHQYIMDETSQSTSQEHRNCRLVSTTAMDHRTEFRHDNIFGKLLQQFCRPQTSICRAIWKKQVIACLETEWKHELSSLDVPEVLLTFLPFADTLVFVPVSESHFVFETNSQDLYEENRLRAMLRTILFAMTTKDLNKEDAQMIWDYNTNREAQSYIKQNFKEFFVTNPLVELLMKQNPLTPDHLLTRIDELWARMCVTRTSFFV